MKVSSRVSSRASLFEPFFKRVTVKVYGAEQSFFKYLNKSGFLTIAQIYRTR